MNRLSLWVISVLTVCALIVAGCGGASSQTYAPKLDITSTTPGNFSITGGAPQTITPGGSATFTISSSAFLNQSQSRSNDPISLVILSGLPSGATGTLNPTSVIPGENSTLTIQTVEDTAPQNYDIVVQGTQNGVSKTATVRLTIDSSFVLNGGGTRSVLPGETASYTLTPARQTEDDQLRGPNDVTFTVTSGLPTGATGSFNPTFVAVGNSGTFNIVTSASTPLGSYDVVVTATWGTKTATRTVTLNVVAPDFFLSAPSVVNMNPGVTTDVTINVNPVVAPLSRGFDDVTLRILDPIPSGFTATLVQTTAKIGGTVTLRLRYDFPDTLVADGAIDPIIGVFSIEGTNGAFTHTVTTSAFVSLEGEGILE